MSIKIKSYGGLPGWIVHKYLSRYFIGFWFWGLQKLRKSSTERFVYSYVRQNPAPIFRMVEIETINRCNGRCAFCPANVESESRSYKKMSEKLFEKIALELGEMDYSGDVLLEVNNEPLIDTRLGEFAAVLKEKVPKCKIGIITNGTLLTIEKLNEMLPVLDVVIINNYSNRYRLNDSISQIYHYIKNHKHKFKNIKIEIRRRYIGEVLANRAGTAPNHKESAFNVTMPCLYPFVGITIFPDGIVGLCSNDCFEQTNYGDVNKESILDIWNGEKMRGARRNIARGRKHYEFCKNCDVIGLGTREKIAEEEKRNER